ncbi:hypothetical protein C8R45DRAFT_961423 [Mycena sanguinolenta]|nr:hypothetical protein C8R45DRAFT_961423 [Mycena sanguinolenta]
MSSAKPAKFKTPTCVLCRRRKLRCDGGDPCGPCSRTRTPVICTYVPKTVGQLRSELPKGGACITCRQRKRRCDGTLPCITCVKNSRPDECQYREKGRGKHKPPKPATREASLSDSASTSSDSSSRPTTPISLAIRTPAVQGLQNQYLDVPIASDSLLSWSDLDSMCHPTSSKDPTDGLFVLPNLDSISFAPSTFHIDPSPQNDRNERFAMRNLFLEHSWQYGLSVTTAKREALSMGDTSGLSVDPILLDVCELMGHIHSHPEAWLPVNTQTEAEAELERSIRDKLDSVSPGTDPLVCLQAYTLLSLYFAQKEDMRNCQEFLVKANDIAVYNAAALGLGDTPTDVWCPQFDASYLSPHGINGEVRAVFSQMIYLDIQRGLILNLPSVIDTRLVEKFRRLLGMHWADTEVNFMRAKSVLFLNDSKRLVAAWNRWEFCDPEPTAWSKCYWSLIEDIHAHITFVNTALMDVSCIPTLQRAQPTLKTCIITAQAALAELYGLFAPSQAESRQKHQEVVTEIISITQTFSDKDYQCLDPILSVCWSIAFRTLPDAVEWSSDTQDNDFRSGLPFFHAECNRKLRRASSFAGSLSM